RPVGSATSLCWCLPEPSPQFVRTWSRRSPSTVSWVWSPGVVKTRWILTPLRDFLPLRVAEPLAVSVISLRSPSGGRCTRWWSPSPAPWPTAAPLRICGLRGRRGGVGGTVLRCGALRPQLRDLLSEVLQGLEAAVDAREAQVGDLVQVAQGPEDGQPDLVGGDLGGPAAADGLLDPLSEDGEGVLGDRAALAGPTDPGDDLAAGEGLGDARPLGDHEQHGLLGGEPPLTGRAGA